MNLEITGTGCCIPEVRVPNSDFVNNEFFTEKGEKIEQDGAQIISKFSEITGIEERRYASQNQVTSDIASLAANRAIEDAGIDPETLDGIFVAHNFGDVGYGQMQSNLLPCIGSRVKNNLQISNPNCVAFDILYGCPGWIQCVITAYTYIKAGMGKRYLVVGAETLSRKLDPHDRDSMIFSDGAGACILEAQEDDDQPQGILSTVSKTFTKEEAYYLHYDISNNPDYHNNRCFIKMKGRKIFEFGLNHVPAAMKDCLDKAHLHIDDVKKILIHQANEKMDEAIIKRLYRLYRKEAPDDIMPMSIRELGNSSVATVPTLLDKLLRNDLNGHTCQKGDVLLMASVGSGMSINAVAYRL